jgi:hypothetical protein
MVSNRYPAWSRQLEVAVGQPRVRLVRIRDELLAIEVGGSQDLIRREGMALGQERLDRFAGEERLPFEPVIAVEVGKDPEIELAGPDAVDLLEAQQVHHLGLQGDVARLQSRQERLQPPGRHVGHTADP